MGYLFPIISLLPDCISRELIIDYYSIFIYFLFTPDLAQMQEKRTGIN